ATLLRELGQGAHRCCGGVAATDHDDALARVLTSSLADHVVHTVGDLLFGRDLAGGWYSAVADPCVSAVGPGTVEADVRLGEALNPFVVPEQQTKWGRGPLG